MICPAPGVFYVGEQVLAFIDKREKADDFYVHALSYGVKHGLSLQDYQIYKTRILEMKMIDRECDLKKKDDQVLDWLVRCAESPVTRWEGVYELSPESDFMSSYDRDGRVRKDIFLSSAQRQRLYNALFVTDTLEYPDLALVDMVMGINDKALLDLLKSGLLKMNDDYNWPARFIMERIVGLTGNTELEKLLEEFSKINYGYNDEDRQKAKKTLGLFIDKMKGIEIKQKILASTDNDS
jgi:hypothetical protein